MYILYFGADVLSLSDATCGDSHTELSGHRVDSTLTGIDRQG